MVMMAKQNIQAEQSAEAGLCALHYVRACQPLIGLISSITARMRTEQEIKKVAVCSCKKAPDCDYHSIRVERIAEIHYLHVSPTQPLWEVARADCTVTQLFEHGCIMAHVWTEVGLRVMRGVQ